MELAFLYTLQLLSMKHVSSFRYEGERKWGPAPISSPSRTEDRATLSSSTCPSSRSTTTRITTDQ